MKLINPSVELVKQDYGILGIFKQIEKAARNCYKSEDKITDNSWEPLLTNIKSRGHLSPFEFGTVYLTISHKGPIHDPDYMKIMDIVKFYSHNKYSRIKKYTENHYEIFYYITTNMRVILENDRIDDLQYFTDPTDKHVQRVCFRIITDRGVLAEITRHRVFSYCVESTRYCNYSLGKFNNEITYIIPPWVNKDTGFQRDFVRESSADTVFLNSLIDAEYYYRELIERGWKPQQARQVLPNALKTEIMMCGFIDDYDHFFDLRMSEAAHPSMRQVASMMHSELYPTKEENK